MRKNPYVFWNTVVAICMLSLTGLRTYGQEGEFPREQPREEVREPAAQRGAERVAAQGKVHPNGIVQDWSRRHLVFPRVGPLQSLIKVQKDPRAILSWQASAREDWHRYRGFPSFGHNHSSVHRDWSINLGGGTTDPAMYPAKYTFDINATPSCSTDFIVFPIDAPGGATQPTIVAFNNLYSGSLPAIGICNRSTPPAGDDGVSATTLWSYNIQGIPGGGQIPTSPTLSLDGTRIAFVESASGAAHLHVLAPKDGDGVDTITPNAQNVFKPVTIAGGFSTTGPVAGSGTVTDLALGSSSDTLSSPFVDYSDDLVYIGNDTGTIFRVKNIFCATLACESGGRPAPNLDGSWGTGGALATGCTGVLTGVVQESGTGRLIVGCSNGLLYGFTSAGAPLSIPTLTVGDGTTFGGIVDPPMVDVVNHYAYVTTDSTPGGYAALYQAQTDFLEFSQANLDPNGTHNLHAPAFNDAYFTSLTASNWLIYTYSANVTNNSITMWSAGFGTAPSHVMNSFPGASDVFTIGPYEISPLTEILNAGTDWLFGSALHNGSIVSYNITPTSSNPSGFPTTFTTATSVGSGTSGIIVDNVSSQGQASSIYFGQNGPSRAVKLTQVGLQ